MEKLANSTINKLWKYFTILVEFPSGLLEILFIFRAVKFLIETTLTTIALHKWDGCSVTLFALFWNTLTLFVWHQRHYKGT